MLGCHPVKVFCEVLTILADISPRPIPIDEIGQRLGGVKGLTLQQKFGAVSRWIPYAHWLSLLSIPGLWLALREVRRQRR